MRTQSASWQIPTGVTKANWEYTQAGHISTGYDDFLEGDPLTAIDRQILVHYFPEVGIETVQTGDRRGPVVADYGCGNGRTLAPLLRRGYRGIGIDLSIPMLSSFARKESKNLSSLGDSLARHNLLLVQANLVQLDGLADDTVDHGVCLFSTLGMIQGAGNRAAFLAHVRRMVKPGGMFILHVHNVWSQIRYPGGFRWAMSSAIFHCLGKSEFGDRTANYRGIHQMFIHSFRRRELVKALHTAGFHDTKWYGVMPGETSPVEKFPIGSSLGLVGWIVVCK